MKQSEQLTPVDLMVLLHEDKEIGIKPAIEGMFTQLPLGCLLTMVLRGSDRSYRYMLPDCRRFPLGCFSSRDAAIIRFGSTPHPILAHGQFFCVVLRRVWRAYPRRLCSIGHPSRDDIQEPGRLRLHHAPLAPYYKKDLDEPAALGGLHPVRQSDRTSELWRAAPTSARAAEGADIQAAGAQGRLTGVCCKASRAKGAVAGCV